MNMAGKNDGAENPQRMSGRPWHGGQSGTTFQYATETGCWDCKACGVGGDVLDFVHKIRTDDMHRQGGRQGRTWKPTSLRLQGSLATTTRRAQRQRKSQTKRRR